MDKLTAQERVFEITRLLYENHVNGLSNKELAQRIGTSEVNICRDLAVFEQYKWVGRSESGRWRISGQIIKSYQKAKLALVQEEAEYLSAIQ